MKETDIPIGWKKVKLKEVLKEVNVRNKDEKVKRVLSVTNSRGFINQEEYFEGTVHSTNISNYKVVRKKQFAYNPSRVNVGSIDILENYKDGALSPMYIVFEVDANKLLPEYFKYYFQTNKFYENVKNNTQGSVRNSLSFKALSDFNYLLPPIKEQEAIVKILKNIKFIIDSYNKKISYINLQKKYIENLFFTRGLKDKCENNKIIGKVPKEWKIKKLCEVADYVDYRGKTPKKVDKGVRLITAKNIKKGYIDYEVSKEYIKKEEFEVVMKRGKVTIGDVLITTEAPCGNVAQVDNENIALAQRVIKYTGKKNVILNSFLKYYMLGDNFQNRLNKLSTGGTAQGIKGSILHKMQIAYPSIEEQKEIVEILEEFDYIIKKEEKQIEYYTSLKYALMQQLLTGKVRVKI